MVVVYLGGVGKVRLGWSWCCAFVTMAHLMAAMSAAVFIDNVPNRKLLVACTAFQPLGGTACDKVGLWPYQVVYAGLLLTLYEHTVPQTASASLRTSTGGLGLATHLHLWYGQGDVQIVMHPPQRVVGSRWCCGNTHKRFQFGSCHVTNVLGHIINALLWPLLLNVSSTCSVRFSFV